MEDSVAVLIVDDEPFILDAMQFFIEENARFINGGS